MAGFPRMAEDDLRSELATALPELKRFTVTEVHKAFGHQCFLLRAEDRAVLFKIARLPAEIARLELIAEHSALAERASVRVPRILGTGHLTDRVGGRPYLVQEYIEGRDAEEAWPSLGSGARLALLAELGAEVGRLHQAPAERFTEGTVAPKDEGSWEAHVKNRLENLVKYNRKAAVLTIQELGEATTRIAGLLAGSAASVRPTLVHRDLCLRNVLVDSQGRLRALLDLEHARLSDPLMDFVKLRSWLFETHPGSEPAFMEGYRRVHPAPWPHERERIIISEGLELLGEIPYYKRGGNEPWLMAAVERLRAWLEKGRISSR